MHYVKDFKLFLFNFCSKIGFFSIFSYYKSVFSHFSHLFGLLPEIDILKEHEFKFKSFRTKILVFFCFYSTYLSVLICQY